MTDKKKEDIRKEQKNEEQEFSLLWKNATPVNVEVAKNSSVVISVRLAAELLDDASQAANHLGVSLNKFIKTAIEEKTASLQMLSKQGLTSLIKSLTEQLTHNSYVVIRASGAGSIAETTSTDKKVPWKISGTDMIIPQSV